ncbi:MAG: elongation factor P [Alphaproteobacteria bacterium]|jgi:elongation factor P
MKIDGNAIRPGMVIEHKGRLLVATKIQHTQPGKGGAYLQVELKDIRDGTKMNERFRSSETVERVRLYDKEYQFLFADDDNFTFMDTESFEQIEISRSMIGDKATFMQDGMMVAVQSHDDEPLGVSLPETVILVIEETEAVVKGQTAASSYKPAILENGLRVMVPPHVTTGTRIVVNTEDATYRERAKG